MTLIGIAGFKRSGKNTLAEGLADRLGLKHESFADPLRRFVAHTLGWTLEELEARKEEPVDWLDGVTARQMMQTVGTEWGRQTVHPELWVRSLVMARLPRNGAIISDVRFPNEAEAILSLGGVVYRVTRPGFTGDGHSSEVPLPDHLVTHEITNDGAPADLVRKALELLSPPFGWFPNPVGDDAE